MKALMPILVAITGVKALKALILSKLAILIVVGFIVYQLCMKAGKKYFEINITFVSIFFVVFCFRYDNANDDNASS